MYVEDLSKEDLLAVVKAICLELEDTEDNDDAQADALYYVRMITDTLTPQIRDRPAILTSPPCLDVLKKIDPNFGMTDA